MSSARTFRQEMLRTWARIGTKFLPFADVATPTLPLSRLLRLSLFQISVGMALVLMIGTLTRVMIVELHVPATLVGLMISLPLLAAPFRAVIGFRSDHHRSELGWRRVPYIWMGTLVQFGGLSIMPFALLVLSGLGHASHAPAWVGQAGAAIAFLLVGAGLHTTQTVGLALATDLAPPESRPKVVGLMYVMLLLGMMGSAVVFGLALAEFSPYQLIQVIQASAVTTLVLNTIALWKQEPRKRSTHAATDAPAEFSGAWQLYCRGEQAPRRLLAIGLGTMAFTMEDVLLEPYGGEILHLTVGNTTLLTATLAIGGLLGFALASRVLSRGMDPLRLAGLGAVTGLPAFALVIFAAPTGLPWMFAVGTALIGFGAGLFGHGTLTATMNLAPASQSGLALGAWGAVQATGAGVAVALSGILRDLAAMFGGAAFGYTSVYTLEIVLLALTILTLRPLLRQNLPSGKLSNNSVA
jgi:BCD family chlorophyll transporter-like MFS transporter